MKDLKDRVAVVTGAASGIGRGLAESFAAAGMKVVLSDVREKELGETTTALRQAGADVHPVVADVSDHRQVEALAQKTVKKYGAAHVVCNNAGIGISARSTWESTLDDWNWIIGVNLMGVVHGVRSFLPIMLEQGSEGHVVNTASLAGLIAGASASLYAVTKFGVVALSEHLYGELQRINARVSVSVLCPGWVNTDIIKNIEKRPAAYPNASLQADDPVSNVFRDWVADQVEHGMSPGAVGEQVVAAIRDNRFYILTHPDWNYLIEQRMKNILAGNNPSLQPPPGFDELVKKLAQLGIDASAGGSS